MTGPSYHDAWPSGSSADAFLIAAESAVPLVEAPAVAPAWAEPSTLTGFSVDGLAGHLVGQILAVGRAIRAPGPGRPADEPAGLPEGVLAPVLSVLTGLALRRHGQAALLRALSRAERAPASIAAM